MGGRVATGGVEGNSSKGMGAGRATGRRSIRETAVDESMNATADSRAETAERVP